jgi:hypothetical protein
VFGSDAYALGIISGGRGQLASRPSGSLELYRHLAAGAVQRKEYALAEDYYHLSMNMVAPRKNVKAAFYHVVFRMYFLVLTGDKAGTERVGQAYVALTDAGRSEWEKQVSAY